jgi:hypothetical protein
MGISIGNGIILDIFLNEKENEALWRLANRRKVGAHVLLGEFLETYARSTSVVAPASYPIADTAFAASAPLSMRGFNKLQERVADEGHVRRVDQLARDIVKRELASYL